MRIHSDTLTESDLYLALSGVRDQVGLAFDYLEPHGSRRRARAFELHLGGTVRQLREFDLHHKGSGQRRYANQSFQNGAHASGYPYAASYDEWGIFLAALFELDPEAVAGPYDGRDGFHSQTANCYRGLLLVRARRQGGRAMSAPSFTETVEAQGWDDGTIQTLLHDFIASRGLDEEFRAYAAEVAADENTQAVEMGWS